MEASSPSAGSALGTMQVVSQMTGDVNWPLAVDGAKIALYTDSGLAVYDTTTPAPTVVTQANRRGWGYTSDVLLEKGRAICALGAGGLETVLLTNASTIAPRSVVEVRIKP